MKVKHLKLFDMSNMTTFSVLLWIFVIFHKNIPQSFASDSDAGLLKISGALRNIIYTLKTRFSDVLQNQTFLDVLEPYFEDNAILDGGMSEIKKIKNNVTYINERYEVMVEKFSEIDLKNLRSSLRILKFDLDSLYTLSLWDDHSKYNRSLISAVLASGFRSEFSTIRDQHVKNHLNCSSYRSLKEKYYFIFNNLIMLDLKYLGIGYYELLKLIPTSPGHEKYAASKMGRPQLELLKVYMDSVSQMTKYVSSTEFKRCEEQIIRPKDVDLITFMTHTIKGDWLKIAWQ